MELIIVAILIVAVLLVLIFTRPSTNSNRNIVNVPYKPIEMPKYTQSTYSKELRVKPYEEPVLIAPDNIAKEIFTRGNTKPTPKKKNTTRKNSKKSDDTNNSSDANANFDMNVASLSASDDNHKNTSCTPSYSSRSCESPVESYSSSSSDYSSSSDSSSSSCDSGGGSCGGGD